MQLKNFVLSFTISKFRLRKFEKHVEEHTLTFILTVFCAISVYFFIHYYLNGLGLAYNDARSHLDIGRRVVEGLKPGIAQLGSVWLPLPHLLMVPTIWIDFFWHSGLSGALVSMASFVWTVVIVYRFLKNLGVGVVGRLFGVTLFAANLNILYLQSTAMTELLLLATMTTGAYHLTLWAKENNILHLIKAGLFILLSTVTRYDGWFLLMVAAPIIVVVEHLKKESYRELEGKMLLFGTLAGVGVVAWLFWNLLIFNDPLYFAFGPFSARAQQSQLEAAGELATKGNLWLSIATYIYAVILNSYAFHVLLGVAGIIAVLKSKLSNSVKIAMTAIMAPLFFNILALYIGHSVLSIQGFTGGTWFNVRYGIMLAPALAVFGGFLVDKLKDLRLTVIGLFVFVTFFAFANNDAVTIDDATVGSSQKNVTEVSGWLSRNAAHDDGFIMISAASHDAIIFSSGLPMKKFIHEGTGLYWQSATTSPDRWARWIVMRTYDNNDLTWRFVSRTKALDKYHLVESYPFADVYEIDYEYIGRLNTKPIFGNKADLEK